ncbi:MAG: transcriptional repressor [Tannerella sp.]|jgi:Fe2+ or Zn2+ uptake regulation protein|nr:transcriptional repressor [Tannerella sp.]
MKSTQEYLIAHDIKPSVQRLGIMEYLLSHRTHPTADEVYWDLQPSIPTLSKTTVYNTMKLFVEQGVAIQIDIDERNARFDGVVEAHAHFYCKKCGCIIDLPLPQISWMMSETYGFTVDETCVNLKGICEECKKKS